MKNTPKQQSVIDHENGNIVVSASAGSGKTRVMVERVVRLIIEGKAEINEILAVTFTKAAAQEMKERIASAIRERLGEKAESGADAAALKRQIELLPLADISTIDSFCSALIRKYFYAADVDPAFKIIDEAEQSELRRKAIDDLFEELYELGDADALRLLEVYVAKRSDARLKAFILKLHDFVSGEKSPEEFFSKCEFYYTREGLKQVDNRLIALFSQKLKGLAKVWSGLSERAYNLGLSKIEAYFKGIEKQLLAAAEARTADEMKTAIFAPTASRPRLSNDEKTDEANELIELGNRLKERFREKIRRRFSEIFWGSCEERYARAESGAELVRALIRVTKLFGERYALLKRDASALDFADVERKALELLADESLASEVRSQYKFVFVDEYQDSSGVQDAIFERLSCDNLLVVGDVKQSIYAFRGSNPEILKEKIGLAQGGGWTHVDLDENFRSSRAVLNAVNNVFGAVMTEETGVDYAKAPMTGGGNYGAHEGEAVIHVVSAAKTSDKLDVGVYGVAKHLAKIKPKGEYAEEKAVCDVIADGIGRKFFDVKLGAERALTFGDVAVLTRTNGSAADKIVRELVGAGIPVISESNRSIGEYPEIKFMINLLEFVVSPTRDVSLAAVLTSAVGGFTEDELAELRERRPSGSFYDACASELKGGELADRLSEFFGYFDKIRLLAQFKPASEILRRIIEERGYLIKLLSSRLGQIKLGRVNRFLAAGRGATVGEFLDKLDGILGEMTVSEAGSQNAVRVMSYHKSKGLEFPFVVIAELDREFSDADREFKRKIKKQAEIDREFGLGVKAYDLDKMVAANTLVFDAIKFKKKFELATEEMRLLYVAMTRARYALHLFTKKCPARIHTYDRFGIADRASDFLACSDAKVVFEPQSETLSEVAAASAEETSKVREVQEAKETQDTEIAELGEAAEDERVIIGAADREFTEEISRFIGFEYPYAADTVLHLKRSVTDLLSVGESLISDERPIFEEKPLFDVPLNEVGTAYHRFLETCDFSADPEAELERLEKEGLLTAEQAKLLDSEKLKKILRMDVFKGLSGARLYREQPFILNVPCKVLKLDGGEDVLVQGVIDLLAVTDGGAYVIDYKFSAKSDEALRNTYAGQLELYAYAAEKILKMRVKGKTIININSARAINLD